MKKPTLKSFEGLSTHYVPPPPPFIDWNSRSVADIIVREATNTLTQWLDASLRELIRERVNENEVQVTTRGGRTVIRVSGVDRFEFKLKFTYGKAGKT
jgi:hypothetical protein